MYKKIKNGSFMNLFWFIICLFPIILLIVYSIQFINTKSYFFNLVDNDAIVTNEPNLIGAFIQDNYFVTNSDSLHMVRYNVSNKSNNKLYVSDLSFFTYPGSPEFSIWFLNGENTLSIVTLSRSDFDNNFYSFTNDLDYNQIMFYINRMGSDVQIMLFSSNSQIFDNSFINNGNYNIDASYVSGFNLDYQNYLDSVLNSFASNGFINNTLLQVVNYFSVNNVYMKLALLYIEYFIIIQLLHLFVDFMLLIPNICHKFMEKIGGERD